MTRPALRRQAGHAAVTRKGAPRWVVANYKEAPGKVLLQAAAALSLGVSKTGQRSKMVLLKLSLRPISGREDQAGGLMWRWKDGNNYYVARANALENNVSLITPRMDSGERSDTSMHLWEKIPGTRCALNFVAATSSWRSMERPTSNATTTTSAGRARSAFGRKRQIVRLRSTTSGSERLPAGNECLGLCRLAGLRCAAASSLCLRPSCSGSARRL